MRFYIGQRIRIIDTKSLPAPQFGPHGFSLGAIVELQEPWHYNTWICEGITSESRERWSVGEHQMAPLKTALDYILESLEE